MTSHRITPLTESGLLSALTVILALAAVYLPVVGVVASLVWAIPVIVLVVRHGLRWGAMAVLVSGVIMALLIEPTISLRMVLSFGPTGLVLGYAFRRRWSGAQAFGRRQAPDVRPAVPLDIGQPAQHADGCHAAELRRDVCCL